MAKPTPKSHLVQSQDTGDDQAALRYVAKGKKSGTLELLPMGLVAVCIGVSLLLVFF